MRAAGIWKNPAEAAASKPVGPDSGALHEVVLDLVEEALFGRAVVHGQSVAQLLEQFPLFAGEAGRHTDIDMDVKIAAAAAVQNGHAFSTETELGATLGAFGNLKPLRLFERRHFDFAAQRGLRHVDGNGAVQVVLLALEKRMRPHLQE